MHRFIFAHNFSNDIGSVNDTHDAIVLLDKHAADMPFVHHHGLRPLPVPAGTFTSV